MTALLVDLAERGSGAFDVVEALVEFQRMVLAGVRVADAGAAGTSTRDEGAASGSPAATAR